MLPPLQLGLNVGGATKTKMDLWAPVSAQNVDKGERGNMVKFGTLHEDGRYEERREIPNYAMHRCPHTIMVPEHYREDLTCRCDDFGHTEMEEWGYTWNVNESAWT